MTKSQLIASVLHEHKIPESLRQDMIDYVSTFKDVPRRLASRLETRKYRSCLHACRVALTEQFFEEVISGQRFSGRAA